MFRVLLNNLKDQKVTKIALVGSAPTSVDMAPWADKSWTIWTCSPGAWPHIKRTDAHFEIHRWEKAAWFSPEYIAWMATLPKVYMQANVPEIPNSVPYPKEDMLNRFGPYVWTSSLSWMFALAITQGATEIALFGVDMSATEEYIGQRSDCHHFIHLAKSMGIKVWMPHESDLNRPFPLYGFHESDPMYVKLRARMAELQNRHNDAIRREAQAHDERIFLQGAIDDVTYMMKTWIQDAQAIQMAYAQPDWVDKKVEIPAVTNGQTVETPAAIAPTAVVLTGTPKPKRKRPAAKRSKSAGTNGRGRKTFATSEAALAV